MGHKVSSLMSDGHFKNGYLASFSWDRTNYDASKYRFLSIIKGSKRKSGSPFVPLSHTL